MESKDYVIRGGLAGRERLRILSRVMLPTTRALLERVGIAPGKSCLDVGCGGGDVTLEIARLVGPSGRVVGLDADATKVTLARNEAAEAKLANVEFKEGEVGQNEAAASFDFVYARFLLTHLRDPAAAARWMRGLVRPGGVLVVEDIDCTGHFCHPDHAAFRRYVDLYTKVVQKRGADPNIGPRLPELLFDAGCENVQMNVVQPAGFEGEVKMIAVITLENIADALIAECLSSRGEIDVMLRDLDALARHRRTVMSLPRVIQTWGVAAP
jgi:SAM-dependent methyltransferase